MEKTCPNCGVALNVDVSLWYTATDNPVDPPSPDPTPGGSYASRINIHTPHDYALARSVFSIINAITKGDGTRNNPYIIEGDTLQFRINTEIIPLEIVQYDFYVRSHLKGHPCVSLIGEELSFDDLNGIFTLSEVRAKELIEAYDGAPENHWENCNKTIYLNVSDNSRDEFNDKLCFWSGKKIFVRFP